LNLHAQIAKDEVIGLKTKPCDLVCHRVLSTEHVYDFEAKGNLQNGVKDRMVIFLLK
tara:strand:- start:1412 stop:1582 length:171 start_codon:yes stop_codon:yes gene_type:complete